MMTSNKMIYLLSNLFSFFLFAQTIIAQFLTGQHLILGTFNTEELILLHFQPENSNLFQIERVWNAVGNHTWLSIKNQTLLATSWNVQPSIASYELSISENDEIIQLRNFLQMKNFSTYISFNPLEFSESNTKAYAVGGNYGEVLDLNMNTSLLEGVQQRFNYNSGKSKLPKKSKKYFEQINEPIRRPSFDSPNTFEDEKQVENGTQCAIVSKDGELLFVTDTNKNSIWIQKLNKKTGLIIHSERFPMPRENDRPKHLWLHPNGKYIYVIQRDTNILDVFEIQRLSNSKTSLIWVQGALTIPDSKDVFRYLGEEVRSIVSSNDDEEPEFLVTSTRGKVLIDVPNPVVNPQGFVTLFKLKPDGLLDFSHTKEHKEKSESKEDRYPSEHEGYVDIYQTPTSGGFSNEVIPSSKILHQARQSTSQPEMINKGQYMVLTETLRGLITILAIEYDKKDKPKLNLISQLPAGQTWKGIQRLPSMAIWL